MAFLTLLYQERLRFLYDAYLDVNLRPMLIQRIAATSRPIEQSGPAPPQSVTGRNLPWSSQSTSILSALQIGHSHFLRKQVSTIFPLAKA
jgi:hypothetical protein